MNKPLINNFLIILLIYMLTACAPGNDNLVGNKTIEPANPQRVDKADNSNQQHHKSEESENQPVLEDMEEVVVLADDKISGKTKASEVNQSPVVSTPPVMARKVQEADAYNKSGYATSSRSFVSSGLQDIRMPSEPVDRENYQHFDDNALKQVLQHPVSTFSIDVDTGAYANVRRFLQQGAMPPHDAVRVEEMINYFTYGYAVPASKKQPFSVFSEVAPSPWNESTHLLHIGIKGYEMPKKNLPASNLVFLVDVSGSMRSPNKLDLLKSSLKLLTKQLTKNDTISLVVYAGASGVVLEPTIANERAKILSAIDRLTAGGSTNGGAGIRLAYSMAEQAFIKGGVNRVLLATDGDFNVGTVNFESLKQLIEEKRKTGIALTTLGFGTGNYNDHLMEQLADVGNGNYAYIDTLNEARKVLVDELSATLMTIAKDVKIQIEFNPAVVSEYRLIGYVNRILKREDFNNDKIDAGEIGAGHTVTALYEVALKGFGGEKLEKLRYQEVEVDSTDKSNKEIAFLRLRYKQPNEDHSQLLEYPIYRKSIISSLKKTSTEFRFSAAVAGFGQLLRGGQYIGDFTYEDITELARNARGSDDFGYRGEFIQIVSLANALDNTLTSSR